MIRTTLALLLLAPSVALAQLAAPYGVQTTVYLSFLDDDGTALSGETDGGTEVTLSCDGGTPATATNDFQADTNTPGRYRLTLTAAELQCKVVTIDVAASVAQDFVVETYGHASAQHPQVGWLTGDAFARLGAPAGGVSISADVAAIESQTDDIGVAGAGLTAIPDLDTLLAVVVQAQGTCDSGSTTTCVDAERTESSADYWKRGVAFRPLSGPVGQLPCVTGFDASTDTLTFKPALTAAITTNTYQLIAAPNCAGVAP